MKKQMFIIYLIVSTYLISSCTSETNGNQFETTIVRKKSLGSTVLATGVVKSKVGAEVRVGSRISGIVKKLNVKIGDFVRKGELLASIDDLEHVAKYNQVKASLDNAYAILKFAKIDKERQEKLYLEKVTSKLTFDISAKNFEIAQAQVAELQASLDYAKIQLDYTKIIAPINGVVSSVSMQEGETVAAMFAAPTFLTIIDLNRLEVRAFVDETDISKVTEEQKAEFTLDTYPGIVFEGIVKAIYPKAEIMDNVVNYIVIIDITDRKGKTIRPEMTTTVNILNENTEQVIAIPNKAITHKNGENYVYILKDAKPQERKITTGIKSKSLTQVINGLSENDKLILNK
ncbi:MAG: efflux RND transporter periplasmic adaptor subunit [Bacteroidetes bacterium]|nr:MAG: efflux RND transporter periplasmic adaptor subunit [Bacteroidota bacterium]